MASTTTKKAAAKPAAKTEGPLVCEPSSDGTGSVVLQFGTYTPGTTEAATFNEGQARKLGPDQAAELLAALPTAIGAALNEQHWATATAAAAEEA